MSSLAFPILTFDDGKLQPSLGYVFDRRRLEPYESIVGILWKFARMNRLAGQLVVAQLCRRPTDPYAGIEPTVADVDVRGLARLLDVTQKTLVAGMSTPGERRAVSRHFRYCSRCLRRGYHSLVHQFEKYAHCPIHGQGLEVACRGCGRTSAYRLDAQLLDAPFRCEHCRRCYASWPSAGFTRRLPLLPKDRVAITRAFLA